jgi:alpha-L-fucosidase
VALLVDIVSKNGNLLLNIGPRPDGSISDIQLDRLHALGRWLSVNGEGIFGTRPWVRASAKSAEGVDIRFTKKRDSVYAFLLNRPEGATLTIPALRAAPGATISLMDGGRLEWSQRDGNLLVKTGPLQGEYAWGLKITPAPQAA